MSSNPTGAPKPTLRRSRLAQCLVGCLNPGVLCQRVPRVPKLASASVIALTLSAAGCYQPMYQPYGYGYGPQMYVPNQPGTIVVPPGNAPLYQPGSGTSGTGGTGTFEGDDFERDNSDNGKFFDSDPGVPNPREPASGTGGGAQRIPNDFQG